MHSHGRCINDQFIFVDSFWSKLFISDTVLQVSPGNVCVVDLVLFQYKFHGLSSPTCSQNQSICMVGTKLRPKGFFETDHVGIEPNQFSANYLDTVARTYLSYQVICLLYTSPSPRDS